MTTVLQPMPAAAPLDSGYITKEQSTFNIICNDRQFSDSTVVDEDGRVLFSLESKTIGTSWTLRRTLRDASGQHILDLRHTKTTYKKWVVEDPTGKLLCTMKDGVAPITKFTEASAEIPSNDGSTTIIRICSFDSAGTKTVFQVGDAIVAELLLQENNDASFLHARGLKRTGWKLHLAGGVDTAMILALVFARAEITHAWRR